MNTLAVNPLLTNNNQQNTNFQSPQALLFLLTVRHLQKKFVNQEVNYMLFAWQAEAWASSENSAVQIDEHVVTTWLSFNLP